MLKMNTYIITVIKKNPEETMRDTEVDSVLRKTWTRDREVCIELTEEALQDHEVGTDGTEGTLIASEVARW